MFKFDLLSTDPASSARAGVISTAHGTIETPIFMPVGTAGAIKGVHISELEEDTRADIMLSNTYHLYLRPGTEIIRGAGGLHRFNGWNKPILTDSGGYQVYSLAGSRKITESGVSFKSHIDGSAHFFSPERAIDIQREIGADIIMAFDECTPYPCDYEYAKNSLDMTHRWLQRCVDRFEKKVPLYGYGQTLLPIVQGSTYTDLRQKSAEVIAGFDLPGNAIGGLSVGEPHEEMYAMTDVVCRILPKDKPRYLMGVGTPANLLENIALGIDMFDCVMPTRNARNGMLYTSEGVMNMRNKKWENDHNVIDPNGTSGVDQRYSRAFLRHLFISGEMLGPQIASLHNLAFYLWLVREARKHIMAGDFTTWKNQMVPKLTHRL
ncbi:MAG: tRNA guanosine(34) transglycosylase Tgt [Cryomorphaceae bacterium]|nr:MAG: tRNA guanosine(34) transglycosylase Tgt [Cryomorphaceae bacterium]